MNYFLCITMEMISRTCDVCARSRGYYATGSPIAELGLPRQIMWIRHTLPLLILRRMGTVSLRQQKELDKFDGDKIEWADFITHFNVVACWNDWTYSEKGLQLVTCLRGKAQKVLSSIPESGAPLRDWSFSLENSGPRWTTESRRAGWVPPSRSRRAVMELSQSRELDEPLREEPPQLLPTRGSAGSQSQNVRPIHKNLHDRKIGGHLGLRKTSYNVRQRFYWPRQRNDVAVRNAELGNQRWVRELLCSRMLRAPHGAKKT